MRPGECEVLEELLFLFGARRVDGGGVELAKSRGVVVWGHFGPVRDRAKREVGQGPTRANIH